jgi:hypothetical protein
MFARCGWLQAGSVKSNLLRRPLPHAGYVRTKFSWGKPCCRLGPWHALFLDRDLAACWFCERALDYILTFEMCSLG